MLLSVLVAGLLVAGLLVAGLLLLSTYQLPSQWPATFSKRGADQLTNIKKNWSVHQRL